MRNYVDEPSCSTGPDSDLIRGNARVFDLISAVKRLHGLGSQELGKLIRDAENNIIQCTCEDGFLVKVDTEKLGKYLALHLIAAIMAWKKDAALFEHLLSGFSMLHSLYDLAPRHPKVEQVLLDDVKVSEQLIDLIFYSLTSIASYRSEDDISHHVVHLYSTLAASCLYSLTACISSQMQELAHVLLAYNKVDIFMDAAFAAVCVAIKFLQTRLLNEGVDLTTTSRPTAEDALNHLCQQCEASLQFLQSLCQQKLFRERIVKNKELSGKGGALLLVYTVLNLNLSKKIECSYATAAAVSRMKSKALSILLSLCEAESVSYLDEVASHSQSMNIGKYVALEVLELLKEMPGRVLRQHSVSSYYPKGQLHLNAMRLADIFSDDSNFRAFITTPFTEVLTAVFSLPQGEFLSSWCSSELPELEEDATMDYDPFSSAGWVLNMFSYRGSINGGSINLVTADATFIPCNIQPASYAHHRTSLLVKVIANLHCFVPHICKDEKDFFLNKFHQCLQKEVPNRPDTSVTSATEKASVVRKNLSSLLIHAESLIPGFLNGEDVQLLRVFISQLESLIEPVGLAGNQIQAAQNEGGFSSPPPSKKVPLLDDRGGGSNEVLKTPSFQKLDESSIKSNGTDQSIDMEERSTTDKSRCNQVVANDVREVENDTQNVEAGGSDSSYTRGKNTTELMDESDPAKDGTSADARGDEKVEILQYEEKLQRKRKRTIMNDKQISIIENALLHELDIHRNAISLQLWAERLSAQVDETNPYKNYVYSAINRLNNRKARLARNAKDGRVLSEGESTEKHGSSGAVPSCDRSGHLENTFVLSNTRGNDPGGIEEDILRVRFNNMGISLSTNKDTKHLESVHYEQGQIVTVLDEKAQEVGKGKVYQVHGFWYGRNLRESGTCVVDIIELRTDRSFPLPYPSEFTGTSFDQAEKRLGLLRVLWDSNKLARLPTW